MALYIVSVSWDLVVAKSTTAGRSVHGAGKTADLLATSAHTQDHDKFGTDIPPGAMNDAKSPPIAIGMVLWE